MWPFGYPKKPSTDEFALQRGMSPSRGRCIFGGYDFSPSRLSGVFFFVSSGGLGSFSSLSRFIFRNPLEGRVTVLFRRRATRMATP